MQRSADICVPCGKVAMIAGEGHARILRSYVGLMKWRSRPQSFADSHTIAGDVKEIAAQASAAQCLYNIFLRFPEFRLFGDHRHLFDVAGF